MYIFSSLLEVKVKNLKVKVVVLERVIIK